MGSLAEQQCVREDGPDLVGPEGLVEERKVKPGVLNDFELDPIEFWRRL